MLLCMRNILRNHVQNLYYFSIIEKMNFFTPIRCFVVARTQIKFEFLQINYPAEDQLMCHYGEYCKCKPYFEMTIFG